MTAIKNYYWKNKIEAYEKELFDTSLPSTHDDSDEFIDIPQLEGDKKNKKKEKDWKYWLQTNC